MTIGCKSHSSLFIGIVAVIALALLMIYGISAIVPFLKEPTNTNTIPAAVKPTVPTADFGNPSRGQSQARLTIVVFGDYECSPCADYEATLNNLPAKYANQIQFVWKDLPNNRLHPNARAAALAARCAQEQGKFWEYHDLLMSNQDSLIASNLPVYATQLQLDKDKFQNCLDEKRSEPLVNRDVDEAIALGVTGTPYTFIGAERFSGALSMERLQTAIDAQLSAPTASSK